MSNEIPETQYDRLLYALGLEQSGEYYRTFFTQASGILDVRMSALSDCIRRGKIVTEPVLEAAKVKGINPDFIKSGTEPVYLEGFAAINGKEMNTVSEKITIHFAGIDGWCRCVFKGDNGQFYKTVELNPDEGFENLSREEQVALLQTLHTTDDFDGEPGWPCTLESFIFCGVNL